MTYYFSLFVGFLFSDLCTVLSSYVVICSESESELFTGDTSEDNHSPGPVFREISP